MLLCDIYESSFYVQVDKDYLFDLSDQLDIEDTEVKSMLDYMVEIGLFDAALWEEGILTSKAIQERYMAAKGRYLNEKKLEQQYLLVPITVAKEEVAEKHQLTQMKLAFPQQKRRFKPQKVHKVK